MAKVHDDKLAAKLKQDGALPLTESEAEVPDEWLALLDHLHGQPARAEREDPPPTEP